MAQVAATLGRRGGVIFTINEFGPAPALKMPTVFFARAGKDTLGLKAMESVPQRPAAHKSDAVVCRSCGTRVRRKARQQSYCSTRCRKRGHYARRVQRGDFSRAAGTDTALGTNPPKKTRSFNSLQGVKLQSRLSDKPVTKELWARILDVEVFDRTWRPVISADGVVSEISRLPPRALQSTTRESAATLRVQP
jgi:hypothetical protein